MEAIEKTTGTGKAAARRLAGLLMSLALAALTPVAALGAEASWTADGVSGSGSLAAAAAAVNATPAAANSTVSVDQNVGTGIGDGNSAEWSFGGTLGSNKGSIAFVGNGNSLTGASGALMRIQYVDGTIGVNGLSFTRGAVTANTGTLTNNAGAGLALDNLGANAVVNLQTATFDRNTITLTDPAATAFQGGGLSVVHSAAAGATNLTNATLSNNAVNVSYAAAVAATAQGGGAYIEKGSATYAGGSIANNSVAIINGAAANGGGLALVDSRTVRLQGGLSVQANSATATDSAAAQGGGVYYVKQDGSAGILDVASGTSFTGNYASQSSIGVADYASGGAIAVTGQAETDIGDASGDTLFRRNYASSANGRAKGGAVSVTSHNNGVGFYYASGDVAVVNGVFEENYASGGDRAMGGAMYLEAARTGAGVDAVYDLTINGGSFAKNYASSSAGDAFGGAVYAENGGTTIIAGSAAQKLIFSENYASAAGLFATASGGALYLGEGAKNLSHLEVVGNSASAASGYAEGGGIRLGRGDTVIENSVIGGNSAVSGGPSGQGAYGGGIYAEAGELVLRDSRVVDNSVSHSAGTAAGSAIYMDTHNPTAAPGAVSSITLEATAGNKTVVSGNKQQGRTHTSGIYFSGTGMSFQGTDAELNIVGAGDVELLNPVETYMSNGRDFTFTKSSAGNLKWDGRNVFYSSGGNATVDLNNGVIELGDYFTAQAEGNTDYTVTIGNVDDLRFSVSRDGDLALFDFSQVGAANSKVFQVSNPSGKTNLTATTGREVKSFEKDYVIIEGLDASEDMAAIAGKFNLRTDGYLTATPRFRTGDGSLIASLKFKSPFEDNANSAGAMDAIESLVKGDWGTANISDAEYYAMLAHARNVTPEMAMEQAFVMLGAADRVSRDAVEHGLRAPHLARLKLDNTTIPASGGYSGGVYETYDSYESYEGYEETEEYYEYGSAYPSLVACDTRGLRVWAGYVGEWRNQDGHGGYNGYRMDRNGIIVGAAYDFGERAAVAVYGGYTASNTKAQNTDSAKVSSDVGHLGVTGRFSPMLALPAFSFYADAGYHWSSNDTHRNLGGWSANGSFDQDVVTLGLGVEHMFYLDRFNIRPFVEGRYSYIDQDGMTETGSSATTVQVAGFDGNAFTTRLGVELSRDYFCGDWVVSPTVSADWRHEFGNARYSGTGFFTKDPTPIAFTVASARMPRDSGDIGASIRSTKNLGSTKLGLNVAYNLNFTRNSHQHSVYAGMDLGF